LIQFLKSHQNIDAFCFQEVFHEAEGKTQDEELNATSAKNLFKDICQILPNHQGFFSPHVEDFYGLAMFVKNEFPILEEGEEYVHLNKGFIPAGDIGHHARNIQFIKTKLKGKIITIVNFHGLWNGKGKSDTEDRINQSKRVLEFLRKVDTEIILCGDFNLLPDTESIKMFEDFNLHNLVKEYGVTSTRTSLYTKPPKFADYIFVSNGIKVIDFKVLPDEVSDHSPLLLDFDI
jgi:exonuclease III